MIDFLLGLAFVAMIVTPALVASSHKAEAADSYFDDFPENVLAKGNAEAGKDADGKASFQAVDCAASAGKA